MYSMVRDARSFDQPNEIIPERWMKETKEGEREAEGEVGNNSKYKMPTQQWHWLFSMGPRQCPGDSI